MADNHNKKVRSYNMSRIRSKDTKPEMIVRRYLHSHGFRYILHAKTLPGKPDVVLPKYKTAIFVHGCFWHKHDGCKFSVIPKTNSDYWRDKICNNVIRDESSIRALEEAGWHCLIVWECDLKTIRAQHTLEKLIKTI